MTDAVICCLSVCLMQVLNKLLAVAATASQQKFASNTWSNVLISTNSVQRLVLIIILYIEVVASVRTV